MYILLTLCLIGAAAGYQPAAPHHSADNLPNTEFSCRDKVLGGYYADPDAQCQMFHVCVKVAGVGIQDFRFLCPNGTAFDQEAQICASWADVACEPAALYYSSDNFDLYRIGSGFESKKAPANFEDEPDFHLQRAEADIFSGAHSSNFFNNRDGKDNTDNADVGGQKKNQVENNPRKKVVKKLQRRPTETTPQYPTTTAKQFNNNFAGSYVPTTSRPSSTSTFRTTPQPQYNTNNNNNNNYYQRSRNQQYYNNQQVSSTSVPYDTRSSYRSDKDQYTQKTEPVVQNSTPSNRYNGRVFKSRTQTTPSNNYNSQTEQIKIKSTPSTENYNNNQYNKESKSTFDYNVYNSAATNNQQTTPKYNVNKEKQQNYETVQSTTKSNYNADTSFQYDQRQSSALYDFNQQKLVNNFEKTTSNYNADNNYNSGPTQPSTPQYSQYYNNNQQSSSQYNFNNDEFEKLRLTTKYVEKNQQTNFNKQTTPQYNYNEQESRSKKYQDQPTKLKYSTNLQYDNNQQSTPLYNFNDQNPQHRTNNPAVPTYEQKVASSTPTSNFRNNNYNQQPSTNDYQQQYNTQQQTNTNQQYNSQQQTNTNQQYNAYQQVNRQTSSQYSTVKPTTYNDNRQEYKSSAAPFKSSKPDDYDDGQYRPELYEREAGGQYDPTVNQNNRKDQRQFEHKAPESELLKTAHSINIAASGNQLARENKQQTAQVPITTQRNSYSQPIQTTQRTQPPQTTQRTQPPQTTQRNTYPQQPQTTQRNTYSQPSQTVYTTTATPRNVYSSIAAVTSAAPRPFSVKPSQPPVKQIQLQAAAPVQKAIQPKPTNQKKVHDNSKQKTSNPKDVSYDYAYYDNSDHYGEYENIEEFRRTSKKQ